jgi:hypothetical protein
VLAVAAVVLVLLEVRLQLQIRAALVAMEPHQQFQAHP